MSRPNATTDQTADSKTGAQADPVRQEVWWKYKVECEVKGRKRWENTWKFVLDEDIHHELWPQRRNQAAAAEQRAQSESSPKWSRFTHHENTRKQVATANSPIPNLESKLFSTAKKQKMPSDISNSE